MPREGQKTSNDAVCDEFCDCHYTVYSSSADAYVGAGLVINEAILEEAYEVQRRADATRLHYRNFGLKIRSKSKPSWYKKHLT